MRDEAVRRNIGKTALLIAFFLVLFSLPSWAQTPLKLGLLLDMSGPYADITGEGTVTAARMAVDDFGGKALGRPIEIVFADHQNKPTSDSPMPARIRSMRSSKPLSSGSESLTRSSQRCCSSSLTSIRWGSKPHKACC